MRLVMLDGFVLAAAGTLIGVLFAPGIEKVLGALLVGVSGTSPLLLLSASSQSPTLGTN
ncbi:MAG TPA: hypothetical protein VFK04_14330 [Gemmatimonadaceae bacterium]|jgi:hypothetical protein|nr:hypothetical protein [Gemmatimonadaceae bacterium]